MLINTFHPDPKIEEWVKELPEEVRLNTMSTRIFQDVCMNSDATLAEQVVNAIKAKRWEKGVALMVHGFPQVVKFKSARGEAPARVGRPKPKPFSTATGGLCSA